MNFCVGKMAAHGGRRFAFPRRSGARGGRNDAKPQVTGNGFEPPPRWARPGSPHVGSRREIYGVRPGFSRTWVHDGGFLAFAPVLPAFGFTTGDFWRFAAGFPPRRSRQKAIGAGKPGLGWHASFVTGPKAPRPVAPRPFAPGPKAPGLLVFCI